MNISVLNWLFWYLLWFCHSKNKHSKTQSSILIILRMELTNSLCVRCSCSPGEQGEHCTYFISLIFLVLVVFVWANKEYAIIVSVNFEEQNVMVIKLTPHPLRQIIRVQSGSTSMPAPQPGWGQSTPPALSTNSSAPNLWYCAYCIKPTHSRLLI